MVVYSITNASSPTLNTIVVPRPPRVRLVVVITPPALVVLLPRTSAFSPHGLACVARALAIRASPAGARPGARASTLASAFGSAASIFLYARLPARPNPRRSDFVRRLALRAFLPFGTGRLSADWTNTTRGSIARGFGSTAPTERQRAFFLPALTFTWPALHVTAFGLAAVAGWARARSAARAISTMARGRRMVSRP